MEPGRRKERCQGAGRASRQQILYVDYDGSLMNKAQFLDSVKAPSLHPEQIVNESMTAQTYGKTAIVTGVYREKGKVARKAYLRRGRFIDTWINQDGTWRCVTSQSTLISRLAARGESLDARTK